MTAQGIWHSWLTVWFLVISMEHEKVLAVLQAEMSLARHLQLGSKNKLKASLLRYDNLSFRNDKDASHSE